MVSLMSWNKSKPGEKQENFVSRFKTLLILRRSGQNVTYIGFYLKNTRQILTTTQSDNLLGKHVSSFCHVTPIKCFVFMMNVAL